MKKIFCIIFAALLLTFPLTVMAEEPTVAQFVDLTPLINAAILVVCAIVTGKLVPYLKARLTDSQFRHMISLLNIGVYAAEELFPEGHGDEKLKMVQAYMKKNGFDVDIEAIKATVNQMRDEKNKGVSVDARTVIEGGEAEVIESTEDEDPQT
ncbi:MAG: hypothetical protein RSD95_02860 [Clostridia bacterium]